MTTLIFWTSNPEPNAAKALSDVLAGKPNANCGLIERDEDGFLQAVSAEKVADLMAQIELCEVGGAGTRR